MIGEPRLRFSRIGELDGRAAGLEVERGGDPVARLEPPSRQRLRVAVEVDEAGGDDEPADVDGRRAVETVADRRDRVTVDPHVAHAVEPGLGIDDPATGQHQVVRHEPTSSDPTRQRGP